MIRYTDEDERYLALMQRALAVAQVDRVAEASGRHGYWPTRGVGNLEEADPHRDHFVRNRLTIIDEWCWP